MGFPLTDCHRVRWSATFFTTVLPVELPRHRWSWMPDPTRRPVTYKATALPTELIQRIKMRRVRGPHLTDWLKAEGQQCATAFALLDGKESSCVHHTRDWLGWCDLNARISVSKTDALPLGYSPSKRPERICEVRRRTSRATSASLALPRLTDRKGGPMRRGKATASPETPSPI